MKNFKNVNSLVQAWNANKNGIQKSNPELGDSIKKIESAINSKIESIIPQGPAQISAFEKYLGTSASDYTTSVEEAKKDPTKVLISLVARDSDKNNNVTMVSVEINADELKKIHFEKIDKIRKTQIL